MTFDELTSVIALIQGMFDLVRVVNVSLTKEFVFKKGSPPVEKDYECYAVWHKDHRCSNCVSAKALSCKGKVTKFEFVDNDVYFVVSQYVEVDDMPYIIEMVTKTSDETLWDAAGKNKFINAISQHTKKLYSDSLTGVYNRRYYDEQISVLSYHPAVAILDVDNFKRINDTYGHAAGDATLKAIASGMAEKVRATDMIIRYGGDEFIFIMQNISEDKFFLKLDEMKKFLSQLVVDGFPEIKVSVSIGAVYMPDVCVKDAVDAADKLLYEAKKSRNTIVTS